MTSAPIPDPDTDTTDPAPPAGTARVAVDTGGSGQLVVLLHGFPQTPEAWAGVVPVLAEAGYRVIVPWLPGYLPEPAAQDVRLPAAAALVGDLITRSGAERAHVVGHDWGALVGWELAADRPDVVATFTALSVPHPQAMLDALPRGQALRSAYVALFRLPGADRLLGAAGARVLRTLLVRNGLPADAADAYVAHLRSTGTLDGALRWYRDNGRRVLQSVGTAPVPTRFVWGRHDPAIGRAAAEGCGRYVTGPYRFDVVDEAHWLPERRPDLVAGLVLDQLAV